MSPSREAIREPPRSVVLDGEHHVVSSTDPSFVLKEVVEPSTALRRAVCEAVDAALATGDDQRLAIESSGDELWLVTAWRKSEGSRQVEVSLVDATIAVRAHRDLLLGKIVHACRNTVFAVSSVLDAMTIDPSCQLPSDYFEHLRTPLTRFSDLLSGIRAPSGQGPSARTRVSTRTLVSTALAQLDSGKRPEVTFAERDSIVTVDVSSVARAIAAMLERAGDTRAATLTETRVRTEARSFVELSLSWPASKAIPVATATLWDLTGGPDLRVQASLVAARATILAHGGEVSAFDDGDRAVLGARLPSSGDD